jgi:hypothetical protein
VPIFGLDFFVNRQCCLLLPSSLLLPGRSDQLLHWPPFGCNRSVVFCTRSLTVRPIRLRSVSHGSGCPVFSPATLMKRHGAQSYCSASANGVQLLCYALAALPQRYPLALAPPARSCRRTAGACHRCCFGPKSALSIALHLPPPRLFAAALRAPRSALFASVIRGIR